MWAYDIRWYFPQCEKKVGSQPTFKFIHPHGENIFSNGWHNARNHRWSKKSWVQLIDHTTLLLHVIATDVWGICLSKANEIMHLGMAFHCINDGLGNSVHQMKD